jgi:hypothetical protein
MIPKTKHFPDGDAIFYWRDKTNPDVIWGQLVSPTRKPKGPKFTYEGPRGESV